MTDPNERPLFPASVVGSMPRSQFVRDLLDPDKTPEDPAVFEKRMNAAVDYIVSLQEAAGLDVISDGEYRRRSYIGIIADVADGFHLGAGQGDACLGPLQDVVLKERLAVGGEDALAPLGLRHGPMLSDAPWGRASHPLTPACSK